MQKLSDPHHDIVTGLGIINGLLLSASKDKMLKLWSLDHQKPLLLHQVQKAHKEYINVLKTNSKMTKAVSADNSGNIKLWDVQDEKIYCQSNLASSTVSKQD